MAGDEIFRHASRAWPIFQISASAATALGLGFAASKRWLRSMAAVRHDITSLSRWLCYFADFLWRI